MQEAEMDGNLPLFVASGIWSAMTPVHEENLERLEVSCKQMPLAQLSKPSLPSCSAISPVV